MNIQIYEYKRHLAKCVWEIHVMYVYVGYAFIYLVQREYQLKQWPQVSR